MIVNGSSSITIFLWEFKYYHLFTKVRLLSSFCRIQSCLKISIFPPIRSLSRTWVWNTRATCKVQQGSTGSTQGKVRNHATATATHLGVFSALQEHFNYWCQGIVHHQVAGEMATTFSNWQMCLQPPNRITVKDFRFINIARVNTNVDQQGNNQFNVHIDDSALAFMLTFQEGIPETLMLHCCANG